MWCLSGLKITAQEICNKTFVCSYCGIQSIKDTLSDSPEVSRG